MNDFGSPDFGAVFIYTEPIVVAAALYIALVRLLIRHD
jgi:hypothetical protein